VRYSAGFLYLALVKSRRGSALFGVKDGTANAAPIVLWLLGKPLTGAAAGGQGGRVSSPAQRLGLEGLTALRLHRHKAGNTDTETQDAPTHGVVNASAMQSGSKCSVENWRAVHIATAESLRS